MQRRTLLSAVVVSIGAAAGGLYFLPKQSSKMATTPGEFEITKTEDEWRKILTDRKSTRLNSSHVSQSRMPSSA